jgi:hypothetical protein
MLLLTSEKIGEYTITYNSINPEAGYPHLQLSGSVWPFAHVENSTKHTCYEITSYLYQVQYSVTAYRTLNQGWSKDLDADRVGFTLLKATKTVREISGIAVLCF